MSSRELWAIMRTTERKSRVSSCWKKSEGLFDVVVTQKLNDDDRHDVCEAFFPSHHQPRGPELRGNLQQSFPPLFVVVPATVFAFDFPIAIEIFVFKGFFFSSFRRRSFCSCFSGGVEVTRSS